MRPLPALSLALLLPACGGPAVGPPVPGGGRRPLEPTLSSIGEVIFADRCASSACHGGTGAAPLDLTPGAAWSNLVNAPSSQTEEMPLVTPQAPDQSYLMLKLLGTQSATGSGAVMPPEGGLEEDELSAVSTWITLGAPND